MSDSPNFARAIRDSVLVFDGAMGAEIARESVIRDRVAGIQVSAPLGKIATALAVIEDKWLPISPSFPGYNCIGRRFRRDSVPSCFRMTTTSQCNWSGLPGSCCRTGGRASQTMLAPIEPGD